MVPNHQPAMWPLFLGHFSHGQVNGHHSHPKIASIQREVGQIVNHWALWNLPGLKDTYPNFKIYSEYIIPIPLIICPKITFDRNIIQFLTMAHVITIAKVEDFPLGGLRTFQMNPNDILFDRDQLADP